MRIVLALLSLPWLAACALPPRVENRADAVSAYETFRGAIARGEIEREWACLSDDLRARLGFRSRTEWEEARRIVIGPRHVLVRGIRRSRPRGEAETLQDGRALLELRFPFGIEGRVVLRREVILRVYADGAPEPLIYQLLPAVEIRPMPGGLEVQLPPDLREDLEATLGAGRVVDRIEARAEWFLDDFALGEESPASVRRNVLQNKRSRKE